MIKGFLNDKVLILFLPKSEGVGANPSSDGSVLWCVCGRLTTMVGRLAMRELLLGPAAASCLNLYHPVAESLHVMIMTLA